MSRILNPTLWSYPKVTFSNRRSFKIHDHIDKIGTQIGAFLFYHLFFVTFINACIFFAHQNSIPP